MMMWEPNWSDVGAAIGAGDITRVENMLGSTLDSLDLELFERGLAAGRDRRRGVAVQESARASRPAPVPTEQEAHDPDIDTFVEALKREDRHAPPARVVGLQRPRQSSGGWAR